MNENNTYTITNKPETKEITLSNETKLHKVCAGFYELRLSSDLHSADRFEVSQNEAGDLWDLYFPGADRADCAYTTLREAKIALYESEQYAAHIARVQS